MARVQLFDASSAPLLARRYFDDGDPGPIVAALATVPELLAPTLGFVGAALGDGAVSTRHKEFAILRTSALQGCRYCIHAHTVVAIDAGLSVDEVRALRGELPVEEAFADAGERALIRWIDAMAGATGPVLHDVWADARSAVAGAHPRRADGDHRGDDVPEPVGDRTRAARHHLAFSSASTPPA